MKTIKTLILISFITTITACTDNSKDKAIYYSGSELILIRPGRIDTIKPPYTTLKLDSFDINHDQFITAVKTKTLINENYDSYMTWASIGVASIIVLSIITVFAFIDNY